MLHCWWNNPKTQDCRLELWFMLRHKDQYRFYSVTCDELVKAYSKSEDQMSYVDPVMGPFLLLVLLVHFILCKFGAGGSLRLLHCCDCNMSVKSTLCCDGF